MKSKTILISGIMLIAVGFVYDIIFAGIPYQDPTPAMIQRYDFHRSIANTIEVIGLTGIVIGIINSILRKVMKK